MNTIATVLITSALAIAAALASRRRRRSPPQLTAYCHDWRSPFGARGTSLSLDRAVLQLEVHARCVGRSHTLQRDPRFWTVMHGDTCIGCVVLGPRVTGAALAELR